MIIHEHLRLDNPLGTREKSHGIHRFRLKITGWDPRVPGTEADFWSFWEHSANTQVWIWWSTYALFYDVLCNLWISVGISFQTVSCLDELLFKNCFFSFRFRGRPKPVQVESSSGSHRTVSQTSRLRCRRRSTNWTRGRPKFGVGIVGVSWRFAKMVHYVNL